MRRQATLTLPTCSLSAVLAAEGFKTLRGPYMGQEADGVPRIFLPGKISSGHDEGCSVFLPGARAYLWRVRRGGPFGEGR